VKFSNVRDITKLTKVLNAVWFGHFRVFASVAKFERSGRGVVRKPEEVYSGLLKGHDDSLKNDGNPSPTRQAPTTGGVATKAKNRGVEASDPKKARPGPLEGLKVGDIVIQLEARKERVARKEGQKHREK
jgi:hypothetical protein